MKLRGLIIGILAVISINLSAKADTYFPYPIVPDSISTLQGRCDYLARHFWDFCDLSKAFSSRAKMAEEFGVYISILRNASADSAITSVERFTKKLEKQPKNQLFITECAENLLYGDSAEMWIDALYIPFAEAIATNKRQDKAVKARYADQAAALKGSQLRGPAPSVELTTRDGSGFSLGADPAQMTVVYFTSPDCNDCNLLRIRLDADATLSQLIKEGLAKIVTVSVGDPDEAWMQSVASYPSSWTVTALPDAEKYFDLRSGTPDFYIIDTRGRVRFKHIGLEQVLDIAHQLNQRTKASTQKQ